MNLYEFLSKFTQDTVPDIYFYAWRIYFAGYNPKDRQTVLALAERDAKEEIKDQEEFRLQRKFNLGRVMNDDLHRGSALKSNGLKRREVNG